MLGFAYDIDPYRAWARVAVDGRFDGPWERKYAVGTIFLRGSGAGVVKASRWCRDGEVVSWVSCWSTLVGPYRGEEV